MVHEAVDLAQTNDAAGGDVGDVRLPVNGKEVMFARGIQSDVLLHQHLSVLVGVIKRLAVGVVGRVQSPKDFLDIHLGDATGCAGQAVVRQIEPKRFHDLAEERLDPRHLLLVIQEEGVGTQGSFHGSADMVVADALGAVEVSGVGVGIAARHGRQVV